MQTKYEPQKFEKEISKLAGIFRENLDLDHIYRIMGLDKW